VSVWPSIGLVGPPGAVGEDVIVDGGVDVEVSGVLVGPVSVVRPGGCGRIGDSVVDGDEPDVEAPSDDDVWTSGVSPAIGVPTTAVLHAARVIIAASAVTAVLRRIIPPERDEPSPPASPGPAGA
jgi:hypothetical protein